MKLVILKTFKWSLFGLLKATKLVIIRSLFCNFSNEYQTWTPWNPFANQMGTRAMMGFSVNFLLCCLIPNHHTHCVGFLKGFWMFVLINPNLPSGVFGRSSFFCQF